MQRLAAALRGEPVPDLAPTPDVPPVYRAQPIYYVTNRFSVVGPEVEVTWPRYSRVMDYELEIAAVIGSGGRNISREAAPGHILGYTIYDDFSARDAQMVEMAGMLGPAKGKSFDAGNAMGPWIVTADEIGDVRALRAEVRVNGEVRGGGAGTISAPCCTASPRSSPISRRTRPCIRARSSARARSAAAAASRSAGSSRTATWWSSRSRGSASCATGVRVA
ncbi:MAG TPA: fumarylacetoacetate hydrolase family protein [Paracoccaceae bacterium]|nr:fumarylacetoacetate hydrolase family protein [Paracoccaceae bacterium]